MTTRPGYVWDDNTSEWVEIGQAAVVAPISYQASAPSSPATGDIWIDSDDEVPGITSSLNYRWRKIATGGETSLSGNDLSGLPLVYNPGYEQLYLNGVLQYRGSDYTATSGSTIAGLTALTVNDTVEVLSFVTAPIGDTYTQAAADTKFYSKTSSASSGEASTVNINTKPWNMPWGLVGYTTRDTIISSITTETATVSVTFNAVAGRNYRVEYYEPVIQASGGSYMQYKIRSNNTSGTVHQRADAEPVSYTSFDGQILDLKIIKQFSAGSNTLVGTIQGVGAGVTAYANSSVAAYAFISVEDMGPA